MKEEYVPQSLCLRLDKLGCTESFKTVIAKKRFYADSGGNFTSEYYYENDIIYVILWQQAFDWCLKKLNIPTTYGNYCIMISATSYSLVMFDERGAMIASILNNVNQYDCLKMMIELCEKN